MPTKKTDAEIMADFSKKFPEKLPTGALGQWDFELVEFSLSEILEFKTCTSTDQAPLNIKRVCELMLAFLNGEKLFNPFEVALLDSDTYIVGGRHRREALHRICEGYSVDPDTLKFTCKVFLADSPSDINDFIIASNSSRKMAKPEVQAIETAASTGFIDITDPDQYELAMTRLYKDSPHNAIVAGLNTQLAKLADTKVWNAVPLEMESPIESDNLTLRLTAQSLQTIGKRVSNKVNRPGKDILRLALFNKRNASAMGAMQVVDLVVAAIDEAVTRYAQNPLRSSNTARDGIGPILNIVLDYTLHHAVSTQDESLLNPVEALKAVKPASPKQTEELALAAAGKF